MASLRAPKRGCSLCSVCGESNGNRALKCRSCGITMQGKISKKPKLSSLSQEVTALISVAESNTKIFSCKVRREGPDYRTFVTENMGAWTCYHRGCHAVQHVRGRSSGVHACEHINNVQRECTPSQLPLHMNLSEGALEKIAVPQRYREELLKLFSENPRLIQRVSESTFVVRDSCETHEHPLSLLHIRFNKSQQQPLFYCPCAEYQRSTSGSAVTAKPTRRCIHLYVWFWAMMCNSEVAAEFPSILTLPTGVNFSPVCMCMYKCGIYACACVCVCVCVCVSVCV